MITVPTAQVPASSPDLIQLWIYSPTGAQIAMLSPGRGFADGTTIDLVMTKYGGLESFTFTLSRNARAPLINGAFVVFMTRGTYDANESYYPRIPIGVGVIKDLPPTETTPAEVKISGIGLAGEISKIKVTETYTSSSVSAIFADLESYFNAAFINFAEGKVSVPAIPVTSLKWKDRTLFDCVMDLVQICNNDYSTEEYSWSVDGSGTFEIGPMLKAERADHFFEGFQFQNPEVSYSSDRTVNKIQLFRAVTTTGKETEFLSTVSDADSIAKYGESEIKLIFPSYIDTTNAELYAQGILTRYSETKKIITIENLIRPQQFDPFLFRYYGLSTRRQEQAFLISDFSSLDEWAITYDGSTVTVSDQGMSNNTCFEWASGGACAGYMDITFDKIYAPRLLRLYINGAYQNFYVDLLGYEKTTLMGTVEATTDFGAEIETNDLVTDDGSFVGVRYETQSPVSDGSKLIGLSTATTKYWREVLVDLSNLKSITGVRLRVNSDIALGFLLDRLEIFADQYFGNALPLERYEIGYGKNRTIIKSATFGSIPLELTEQVIGVNRTAKTYEDVTAKQ